MKKLKHTSWPWSYIKPLGNWNGLAKPDDAEYHIVSNDEGWSIANILDAPNPEANARLITAAPEMLEVIIRCYKYNVDPETTLKPIIENSGYCQIE
jgi:hypothetical protein